LDIDSNEQRAATIRQGIKKMLACYEENLNKKKKKKKNKRSLSRQILVLDCSKSCSRTRTSPPVLLDNRDDDPDNAPTVKEEVPPS
jgi:hypothetical protein